MSATNPTNHYAILSNRPKINKNGDFQYDTVKIHYWEWSGHQPTIIFCHAGSLHGRCYDHIINSALRGYHVISIDLRGHGRSEKHPPPYRSQWIGEDIYHFIEELKLSKENLIGIGHSFGGAALIWAATTAPALLFRSLLLIDPGIVPRQYNGIGDKKIEQFEYIFRRKHQWTSIDEMFDRLKQRPPFSTWSAEILKNYCVFAVDDDIKLQCTPEGEHSIYQTSLDSKSNIFPLIEKSKYVHEIFIHVVRTSLDFTLGQFETSPTDPDLYRAFRKGKSTELKNVRHFFPMDQPEIMIKLVEQHLQYDQLSML